MLRATLLTLMCTFSLFAHKLHIFTVVQNNELSVQSYFASAQGCHLCEVVISQNNEVIIKSKTNQEGHFKTELSEGKYLVSIEATEGHKVSETVEILSSNQSNKPEQNLSVDKQNLKISGMVQNIMALVGLVIIILLLKRIKS